jgi:hypothetical protein
VPVNAVNSTFGLVSFAPFWSVSEFAAAANISDSVARKAFSLAAWRGHHLPVVALPGQRGGASGMVWALQLDKASPDLRALLKLLETLPSRPIERRIKARPDDRHSPRQRTSNGSSRLFWRIRRGLLHGRRRSMKRPCSPTKWGPAGNTSVSGRYGIGCRRQRRAGLRP